MMLNYLKIDFYQLADIFKSFRNLTLEKDGLDLVYYPTLPSLSWEIYEMQIGAFIRC